MDVLGNAAAWIGASSSTTTALVSSLIGSVSYLASLRLAPVISPYVSSTYPGLTPAKQLQWDSRYGSTLHAVVITGLSFYLLLCTDLFSDSEDDTPVVLRTSTLSSGALGYSIGYFATDLVFLIGFFPKYGGVDMGAHHIAALASVAVSGLGDEAHIYTLALLATEVTTPFINARWWLDVTGRRDDTSYKLNGVALLVCWFFGRILLFIAFFYHVYRHAGQILLLTWPARVLLIGVPALLFGLNLVWFKKIVRGAIKVFFGNTGAQPLMKSPRTPLQAAVTPRIVAVPNSGHPVDRKIS